MVRLVGVGIMKRLTTIAFAWIVLAVAGLEGVPVRLPSTPQAAATPVEPPVKFDLRGTSWIGKDFVENYRITFEDDGTLSYGYKGKLNRGGSWTFDGRNLYFEVNSKYREFKGTADAATLQGESWNKTGKRWQTHLQRVK
jgi:hypothetical protein